MASRNYQQTDDSCQCDFKHNTYCTRKTITQGLLDIALLTSNASLLKYVLELGEAYDYYILMVTLLSVSVFLQLARGCLSVVLGTLYDVGEEDHQKAARVLNNVVLCLGALTVVVNAVISGFDLSDNSIRQLIKQIT